MKISSLSLAVTLSVVSTVLPAQAQNEAASSAASSSTAATANSSTTAASSSSSSASQESMIRLDEWRGPLPLENERPFQALFLHLPPQNPDALPRGTSRLGLQLDIANHFLIPAPAPSGAGVTEDFETQRLKVTWRKGLGRDLEFGVNTNITARNGGFFDSTVDFVHKLFNTRGDGFSSPVGRNNIPHDRSIFAYRNAAGQGFTRGSAFGLGDTTLWVKKQLSHGKLASATSVALKLPSGSESGILGSGGFDGGVTFDGRYQFARKWAAFGSVGVAKYGNSFIPGAEDNGLWGTIGYEWRVGRRESIIGQINYAKRAVTTGNAFADRTHTIASIGYKKQVSPKSAYWFAIGENGDYKNYKWPALFNIGPDVTLSFGYDFMR
jgi:hypothetical protein